MLGEHDRGLNPTLDEHEQALSPPHWEDDRDTSNRAIEHHRAGSGLRRGSEPVDYEPKDCASAYALRPSRTAGRLPVWSNRPGRRSWQALVVFAMANKWIFAVAAVLAAGALLWIGNLSAPAAGPDTPETAAAENRGPTSPPRPSLADIALEPMDFRRNAALYELLVAADTPRIRALLAEVSTLPASLHRYDISRVIYLRFVSLDPAAAANHLLDGIAKPSWVRAVYRAWAHMDYAAAVAHAATLGPLARQTAAQAHLRAGCAGRATPGGGEGDAVAAGFGECSALGRPALRATRSGRGVAAGRRDPARELEGTPPAAAGDGRGLGARGSLCRHGRGGRPRSNHERVHHAARSSRVGGGGSLRRTGLVCWCANRIVARRSGWQRQWSR